MKTFGSDLEKSMTTFSGLEVKALMLNLTRTPNICFRFRVIGEMWMKNLMQITAVNERTALFFDEVDTKYYLVRINNIMQFEIDARFQNFQPYFHYGIVPSPELE
jgi:hypothetical protein